MLRETSALSFVHFASLAWRLSIAGRWKLRQVERRERDLKP